MPSSASMTTATRSKVRPGRGRYQPTWNRTDRLGNRLGVSPDQQARPAADGRLAARRQPPVRQQQPGRIGQPGPVVVQLLDRPGHHPVAVPGLQALAVAGDGQHGVPVAGRVVDPVPAGRRDAQPGGAVGQARGPLAERGPQRVRAEDAGERLGHGRAEPLPPVQHDLGVRPVPDLGGEGLAGQPGPVQQVDHVAGQRLVRDRFGLRRRNGHRRPGRRLGRAAGRAGWRSRARSRSGPPRCRPPARAGLSAGRTRRQTSRDPVAVVPGGGENWVGSGDPVGLHRHRLERTVSISLPPYLVSRWSRIPSSASTRTSMRSGRPPRGPNGRGVAVTQ